MMPQNTSQLDIKETIETTFENAKGWLVAKYPSTQNPESNIQINVHYPEIFSTDTSSLIADFKQLPVCLSIQRRWDSVLLCRDVFTDLEDGKEKVSYSIQVRAPMKNYRAIETPLGEVYEQGNLDLLKNIQTDEELNKYISFISKADKKPISSHSKKWQLDKVMELSRS